MITHIKYLRFVRVGTLRPSYTVVSWVFLNPDSTFMQLGHYLFARWRKIVFSFMYVFHLLVILHAEINQIPTFGGIGQALTNLTCLLNLVSLA